MEPPNVLDGYLTPQQLARQLGVTTRTLLRWEVQRIGPTRTVFGRQVLYRVSSVATWLESKEQRRKK